MSDWIKFVKSWSEKKKVKYNDALKSEECKQAYQKQKPKKQEADMKPKMRKTKSSKTDMKAV